MDARAHWEAVHAENAADDVSWFQVEPTVSLRMIESLYLPGGARILDVGTGQAGLPGALASRGFTRVAALDVSAEALRRARERMGAASDAVDWIEADVLDFTAREPFAVWHDRAVLHFLTTPEDQARYVAAIGRNLARDGYAILATFAPDGPEKCSGLPVARHDAGSLADLLGEGFSLLASERETHLTPWGSEQRFQWALFRRA